MKKLLYLSPLFLLGFLGIPELNLNNITPSFAQENDIFVESGEELDMSNMFYDGFDKGLDSKNWYVSKRYWGEVNGNKNGGVIPENISINSKDGTIRLHAKGNYYAKNEVNGLGSIKDGSRTGAVLISKQNMGPGRYETRLKVAPREGICNALWVYTEDEVGNNHEIDIELPGTINKTNSFHNVYFTNYISKTEQTRKVLPINLADGQFHTFGFDWYYSNKHKMINYYIDGIIYATHKKENVLPYLNNNMWLGVWVPHEASFVGKANFDEAYMEVDYAKYIPFKNQLNPMPEHKTRLGTVASQKEINEINKRDYQVVKTNYVPNGDFEYKNLSNNQHINTGLITTGNVIINENQGNESAGAQINQGAIETRIDSLYEEQIIDIGLSYKGQGQLTIESYDINNNLIISKKYDLNSSDWVDLSRQQYKLPKNTFYIKSKIETANLLNIDDWMIKPYFKNEEIKPIEPLPESDAISNVGFQTSINSNIKPSNGTTLASIDLENNGKNWILSRYHYQSGGFLNLGNGGNAVNQDDAIKSLTGLDPKLVTLRKINDEFQKATYQNESHFIHAMYMDYDLDNFNDINIFINAYNVVPTNLWYRDGIMYSTDSGVTWKLLKQEAFRNKIEGNDLFDKYVLSATRQEIKEVGFSKIRFAYVTHGFTSGGVGTSISGIAINMLDNIKYQIDEAIDICDYNHAKQDFLNVEIKHLNNEDRQLFNNTLRKNSKDETYQNGYNYLLQYWSQNTRGNKQFPLLNSKEITEALLILIVGSSMIAITLICLIKKKAKFIN